MLPRQGARLSSQVHEYVKQQLLDGEIAQGNAIPVEAIAAQLGISRQPVMDAVRRLAQEGFVEILPQVGCFPRHYDWSEIADFYLLFAESEAVVARLATQRRTAPGIARMRSLSNEISELRDAGLPPGELANHYRTLNRKFHSEIRAMLGSPAIAEIVETQGDRSDFLAASARAPIFMKRLEAAHDEHERIIAAMEQGDAEAAADIMRRHVLAVAERIADSAARENGPT